MRKVVGKIDDSLSKSKKSKKVPLKTASSNKKKLSHSSSYSSPVKSPYVKSTKKKQSRLSQAKIDTVFSPETSRLLRSPDLPLRSPDVRRSPKVASRSPDENIPMKHATPGPQFKKKSRKSQSNPLPNKSIQHYLQSGKKQHGLCSPRDEGYHGNKVATQHKHATTPLSSSYLSSTADTQSGKSPGSATYSYFNHDSDNAETPDANFSRRETRTSSQISSDYQSTEEETPRRKTRKASLEVSNTDDSSTMTPRVSRTDKSPVSSSKGRPKSSKPSYSQKRKSNEETEVGKKKVKAALSSNAMKKRLAGSMASGDLQTHMVDKQFIDNQIKLLSRPFHLQGDTLKLFQNWKKKEETEAASLPRIVIDNAVRKLNHHLDDSIRFEFTRAQRRFTLQDIDEHRKQLIDDRRSHGGVSKSRLGADIHEVLNAYPMEWPDSVAIDDDTQEEWDDKLERYTDVRSRVFALNRTVINAKQELLKHQSLANLAKSGEDLAKDCNSEDVAHELRRTNDLLTQVLAKLTKKNLKASHRKRK